MCPSDHPFDNIGHRQYGFDGDRKSIAVVIINTHKMMRTLLEKQRSGVPLMTVLMLHPRDLPHIVADVEEEENDEVVDDDGGEDEGGGDSDLPI